MPRRALIVTYHYVRDPRADRHPGLKGRSFEEFAAQLDHVERHHTPIGAERLLEAIAGRATLPENAALLSFDDGYRGNYDTVFPELRRRGLAGLFYAPARAVRDRALLDVHKIHFALAGAKRPERLAGELSDWIAAHRDEHALEPASAYFERFAHASRFDPPDIVFVKRALQKGLPEAAREAAAAWLFARHAGRDPARLADEFYVEEAQLREMAAAGMHVGAHGWSHRWLDTLDRAGQESEIDRSIAFLAGLGVPADRWSVCYPYGGWNAGLLELLAARGCAFGLTTRSAVADLDADAPLLLPRVDTTEMPA